MGYKMSYIKQKSRRGLWILFFFGLFLLCAWYFAGDALRLLGFSQELEEMVSKIEQGSGIMDAVTAFCQDLLNGA